ncbi:MAG TPA: hypothetical protein VI316_06435 [Candidatus Dormibacteraeota bacterium]
MEAHAMMGSQYTPDEAMADRRQLDAAAEELTETGETLLGPPADAPAVAPVAADSPATAAAPQPAAQGWWARMTRGLRRR